MKKNRIAALAGLSLGALLALTGCASSETVIETCTVNDKSASGDRSEVIYLVYTDECGVLTVKDAFLKSQWNSSDTYADISIGKTYDFELYGFRNGFLSSYPNILNAVEVGE